LISVFSFLLLNLGIYKDKVRKKLTKHHNLSDRQEENSSNILESLLKLKGNHKEGSVMQEGIY